MRLDDLLICITGALVVSHIVRLSPIHDAFVVVMDSP